MAVATPTLLDGPHASSASAGESAGSRLHRLALLFAKLMLPLLAAALLVTGWPAADGVHDRAGATFGHDLSQVWVAGRQALAGHPAEVYDIRRHDDAQAAVFGADAARFGWHYPPPYLFAAEALARVPYPVAVLAWATGSLLVVAFALRAITRSRDAVVIALAAPPVATCLSYGQNSLLSAGLLAFGLLAIERRPWLAGALLGALCYKPQLAVVVPMVLVLSGRWRGAVAAAIAASTLAGLSLLAFGPGSWQAFLADAGAANADIFAQGWAGFALNASVFGAARLLGAGPLVAWGVQGAVACAAVATTALVWRRADVAAPTKCALAIAAVPLASPYLPVYDLAILVPALAFHLSAQRAADITPVEVAVLVAMFLVALQPRELTAATHLPFGLALALGTFGLALAGARRRAPSWRLGRVPVASPGVSACR